MIVGCVSLCWLLSIGAPALGNINLDSNYDAGKLYNDNPF